jgi:diguanylate cyclase (GGDEF)-like protein
MAEMAQDSLDGRRLHHRGHDPHPAVAPRAVESVDEENAPQQVCPWKPVHRSWWRRGLRWLGCFRVRDDACPRRGGGRVRLAEKMGRARGVPGYRFSVVVADVDDMKAINDRRGHAAGDQALRWVAGFLSHGLRSDDVCCRIGGDEFLLILPDCGGDECRRFVKCLRARWQADAQAYARAGGQAVAVSLGTASYPVDGSAPEALCAVADAEMYGDKRRSSRARLQMAL